MDRAWLSSAFHSEITDWRAFALQTAARPTHLADIVCRKTTHMGFCGTSGLGAGGVWLDPAQMGHNLVWRNPWPPDIMAYLVSSINLKGTITNSDLDLTALVIHKATLPEAVLEVRMAAPYSGSDNTPTVSWIICEALVINPVVADLFHICAFHLRKKS